MARHGIPGWTFHFTPTSASWLNAVEGFFAKLTRSASSVECSGRLPTFRAAINRFVEETNSNPKPFVWTADPKRVSLLSNEGKKS